MNARHNGLPFAYCQLPVASFEAKSFSAQLYGPSSKNALRISSQIFEIKPLLSVVRGLWSVFSNFIAYIWLHLKESACQELQDGHCQLDFSS